jgi:hypothetical protein
MTATKKGPKAAATKKSTAKKEATPAPKLSKLLGEVPKAAKAEKKQYAQRWSIGLFRNANGGLSTVYVTKDEGVPMPYEQVRVGKAKILFHRQYVGMPYREARVQLLKDAVKAGIKEEEKPTAKASKTASAKVQTKPKPKVATKAATKTKSAETESNKAS